MTTPTIFHVSARRFLEKIVRIRMHLIRIGRSNNPESDHAARTLNMYLEAYHYNTDTAMANFIKNHETDIRETIPGTMSSCGKKLHAEFTELFTVAQQITLSNEINTIL